MRSSAVLVAFGIGVLALTGSPGWAHHSISAMYDRAKTVELQGRLTRVRIINPHALLELEVRAANGAVTKWEVESRGSGGMNRMGLTDEVLAVGEEVKVTGAPARNGGPSVWMVKLESRGKTYDMDFGRGVPAAPPS